MSKIPNTLKKLVDEYVLNGPKPGTKRSFSVKEQEEQERKTIEKLQKQEEDDRKRLQKQEEDRKKQDEIWKAQEDETKRFKNEEKERIKIKNIEFLLNEKIITVEQANILKTMTYETVKESFKTNGIEFIENFTDFKLKSLLEFKKFKRTYSDIPNHSNTSSGGRHQYKHTKRRKSKRTRKRRTRRRRR